MQVRFEATGPEAEADLRSLHRWLADDRGLRGEADVSKVEERSPTQMGSTLEAVLAVVSTAAALSQLPFSYLAWRQGRRPGARIEITVRAEDESEARTLLGRLRHVSPAEPEDGPPQPRPEGAAGDGRGPADE